VAEKWIGERAEEVVEKGVGERAEAQEEQKLLKLVSCLSVI